MGELTCFVRDEQGGMVDSIVTIGILVVVGGAALMAILDHLTDPNDGLVQKVIEKLDEISASLD